MIATERATIDRPVEFVGRGLHEGRSTRLRLQPAEAGTGIRFVRDDIGAHAAVPARIEYRVPAPRRTQLRCGDAAVHTVEHLLAAVHALGITDLEIGIDAEEVPGADGSAAPFVRLLREAGRRPLAGSVPVLQLDRVLEVEGPGGERIVALPNPGGLRLGYALALPSVGVRSRVEFACERERLCEEVLPARTFCRAADVPRLRAAGLGKGANTDNTLVIDEHGQPIDNTLRFEDEYARHKLLDLFGDLSLLGARLEARVLSSRGGHELNAQMCRALAARLAAGPERLPPVTASDRPLVRPDTLRRAGDGSWEAEVVVGEAACRGHFPGAPVIPGVVSLAALLETAARGLGLGRGPLPELEVRSARFRSVLRPGDRLHAHVQRRDERRLQAALWVESAGEPEAGTRRKAVEAELVIAATPPPLAVHAEATTHGDAPSTGAENHGQD